MRRLLFVLLGVVSLALGITDASAQGVTRICIERIDSQGGINCTEVATGNPLPVTSPAASPSSITNTAAGPLFTQQGGTLITGNATGTTAAVIGTLAGTAAKTTYICGFNVSAVGGTATVGPVTVAGLVGSSQVYQLPANTAAGQILVTQTFTPCIPASAQNTAITVTTTANATATAVDVNSWGYQL